MNNIFTMTFPNKKCDNNGMYKDYLLKRLASVYPELTIDGVDTEESPYSYQYIGPLGKVRFGWDNNSKCDVAAFKGCKYCPFAPQNYNLATQFELAMKKLDDYAKAKKNYKPLYDFRLADGTPVKEYKTFIQVGYKLIPKYDSSYFLNLDDKEKTIINNVIVMINNYDVNADINI